MISISFLSASSVVSSRLWRDEKSPPGKSRAGHP